MSIERQRAEEGATPPSRNARRALTSALLLLAAVFVALGTWQMQRLFWKLDLIERVEARIHAEPVPAPARAAWRAVSRETDEYRRVVATGLFQHDKTVLVQAMTERGAGFWVLTPMRLADDTSVLINRGFVPSDRSDPAARLASEIAAGPVTVTGLLRISEPGGGFLRANDPANDRWFSRDVAAIAASKGIADITPYFIDADATPNAGGLPIGGLTVVSFRNSHLVYALTWYALAVMSAVGAWYVYRSRRA
ncbi:SURF1 family protein [Shinella kummerowiae]|jgi:surfeit locus 1 family protein|uniref:SURF1-like protein n=1 Tax=Shinella kummerowiae TaxID=417745 RepID=A0A6N8S7K8_9HYPH|nr:SURF1 family protein [Shinella kummerowiae]MXN44397.1 SURF1 family protein [Shinella kummerowiae]